MWNVTYTRRFLKELSRLPYETRVRAEDIAFRQLLAHDPFELGYLEKMSGYPGKYKIRLGEYRMGIKIDKAQRLLVCQRIAHRKDIYSIFP